MASLFLVLLPVVMLEGACVSVPTEHGVRLAPVPAAHVQTDRIILPAVPILFVELTITIIQMELRHKDVAYMPCDAPQVFIYPAAATIGLALNVRPEASVPGAPLHQPIAQTDLLMPLLAPIAVVSFAEWGRRIPRTGKAVHAVHLLLHLRYP